MTKIKICGLSRPEDIKAANETLPDFIGFVFAKSRRQVDAATAKSLRLNLDKRIQTVGVFVNSPVEDIASLCRSLIIDMIQLHGDEDAEYIAALRKKVSFPIIKAVRVQSAEQILKIEALPCDYLLLDTYQNDAYGGSGIPFDRTLIPPLLKPFFLAGGLDAGNIHAAIGDCRPYSVDISSGVETDGIKDKEKIQEIVRLVRCNNQKG